MPIYEYRCTTCHDDFEVTQKITDAPLEACPKCQGKLEKLISQSSFVLKGGGWYMSDYGRKGCGAAGEKKEGPAPSCAASGSKPPCSGCTGGGD